MMEGNASVWEKFFTEVCTKQIPVTIYLMNGFRLRGIVQDFDASVVLLESEHRQQLVYQQAISTIIPMQE